MHEIEEIKKNLLLLKKNANAMPKNNAAIVIIIEGERPTRTFLGIVGSLNLKAKLIAIKNLTDIIRSLLKEVKDLETEEL